MHDFLQATSGLMDVKTHRQLCQLEIAGFSTEIQHRKRRTRVQHPARLITISVGDDASVTDIAVMVVAAGVVSETCGCDGGC